jgi:hypothetical protein
MKSLIFFFFSVLFSILPAFTCFSQDTIVDNKGLIFTAKITEIDSAFITYASVDTSIKDQIIIPRTNIIFIKYQDGRTEQLYLNDTLVTKDGIFISCKVLEIEQSTLTYFSFGNKFTNSVILRSNLLLVKLHDGTKMAGSQLSMSNTEYFDLGLSDAKAYYKVKPAVIVSEVIMGVGTIFVVPIIAATLIAYVPPIDYESVENPNNGLLKSNKDYKKGYEKAAYKKKISEATLSYFVGLAGFLGTILTLSSFIF